MGHSRLYPGRSGVIEPPVAGHRSPAPLQNSPEHRPPRFFVSPDALRQDEVTLEAAEARHAQVRRLTRGDTVVVFDGRGNARSGHVRRIFRRRVDVSLADPLPHRSGESHLEITLVMALLKADKFDLVIERGTELGVSRFVPTLSRYSLARPSEARRARWRQIALSAVKQCGRTVLPEIEEPTPLADVLAVVAPCRLLLSETPQACGACDLEAVRPRPSHLTLLVGPEGGFATEELDAALAAGWHPISLGPRVLRSETAALVAVALCQHLWGDLRA